MKKRGNWFFGWRVLHKRTSASVGTGKQQQRDPPADTMSYGGYEAYGNEDFGGGGGFMEGSQGGSQGTPNKRGGGGGGGGGRNREAQGLLPITAKQLANRTTSDDDVIRIDGQEVTNVKLVGILSNVTPHSTNVNFQLDDGTGVIEGRMFLHADDADYAENEVSKLRYVVAAIRHCVYV